MRIFLVVIDSFGVGEMPDASEFGDVGSNTYKHIYQQTGVSLPNLSSLGLNNIVGIDIEHNQDIIGNYGKMSEKTKAKDTTAGHYEMAGIALEKPYPTFPKGFPKTLVDMLEKECGCEFIGNEVASGTEIIQRLGDLHLQTKKPILYTSQDSVLQIACCEQLFPLDIIYEICRKARKVLTGEYNVSRVIARPFIKTADGFKRTENRRDFALEPPSKSMLEKLQSCGYDVIAVGKINDIFLGKGISEYLPAKNNSIGLEMIKSSISKNFKGLLFANLVDTDMLYGHRNDVLGYAESLKKIDNGLKDIISKLKPEDILIVTADHGCDPSTPSTDHSREYVPLLVYGQTLKSGENLGILTGFDTISKSILDYFYVENYDDSFLKKLRK